MTMEWKKCHINVPLNNQGISEHESFESEMPNVVSYTLTMNEYDLLEDVFDEWNRRFDLLIDVFEEETLESRYVCEAKEILERFVSKSSDGNFLVAAEKLEEALTLALKVQTPLYLDF